MIWSASICIGFFLLLFVPSLKAQKSSEKALPPNDFSTPKPLAFTAAADLPRSSWGPDDFPFSVSHITVIISPENQFLF